VSDDYDPVRMHLVSTDVDLGQAPGPKRKALKTNTFTLTAANPVQRVMPRSDNRLEAWVTSAIAASSPPVIYIAASQADANALGGGAAQVSGLDTSPFPVNTTDEVWISAAAASLPCVVSVVATYDEPG
jgi:hypothetical protein